MVEHNAGDAVAVEVVVVVGRGEDELADELVGEGLDGRDVVVGVGAVGVGEVVTGVDVAGAPETNIGSTQ